MGRDQATSRALAVWVAFCITQALLTICHIYTYILYIQMGCVHIQENIENRFLFFVTLLFICRSFQELYKCIPLPTLNLTHGFDSEVYRSLQFLQGYRSLQFQPSFISISCSSTKSTLAAMMIVRPSGNLIRQVAKAALPLATSQPDTDIFTPIQL